MSESDRLLGAGVPITLTDGRTVHLRYTMRSLKMIEDNIAPLTVLNSVMGSTSQPKVEPIMHMLAAGLIHEGLDADALLDLTEPRMLSEYEQKILEASTQAFGELEPAQEGSGKANGSARKPRGAPGTTPAPSSSAAATESSGTR